MPKRLARKPSTPSLIAGGQEQQERQIAIVPLAIAQTTTGTRMIRANVMRFGILKLKPRLAAARSGYRPRCCNSGIEYIGHRAIAHNWIPTYAKGMRQKRASPMRNPASISMPGTAWWS